MPSRTPVDGGPLTDRHLTQRDASDETSLELPHERDQATDMTNKSPDPLIKQASMDLKNRLQDTDKRPPMNKAYDDLKKP